MKFSGPKYIDIFMQFSTTHLHNFKKNYYYYFFGHHAWPLPSSTSCLCGPDSLRDLA